MESGLMRDVIVTLAVWGAIAALAIGILVLGIAIAIGYANS